MSNVHDAWYTQVEGQVYGPYTHALMANYVQEGRIVGESLITADPAQGFVTAHRYPQFQDWSLVQVQQTAQLAAGAELYTPQMTQAAPSQAAARSTVFTIMAEIRSGQSMVFLQALQSFGPAQRIGDTVWIVKSATTATALRNALSQQLTRQDRLFIVDSFANETAWFNVGADMDKRIRELWTD